MVRKSSATTFPVARIKKIMQQDEEVGKVAQATPVLMSKALERFVSELINEGVNEASSRGAKKLSASHLKRAVMKTPSMDFLKDLVESIPDPTDPSTAPKSRKRRKVNNNDENNSEGGRDESSSASTSRPKRKTSASIGSAIKDDDDEDDYDDEFDEEPNSNNANIKKNDDDDYDVGEEEEEDYDQKPSKAQAENGSQLNQAKPLETEPRRTVDDDDEDYD